MYDARARLTARVSSAAPLGCDSDLGCTPAGCLLALRAVSSVSGLDAVYPPGMVLGLAR